MAMDTAPINTAETPVCSVCIANYNGIDFIGAAVQSVLAQDCNFAVEIIIHDDASTDGSADYIKNRFPQVNLMTSRSNVGFCISNNRMVKQAKGEYILLLNNDATLFPNALRVLYEHACKWQNTAAILGLPQYNAITEDLIDCGSLLDPFLNTIPNLNSKKSDVAMIIGACLWCPKQLWIKLGGFPEYFQSMAEDIYLCCLARLWGYEVKALSSSGFWHRVGSSFGGGKIVRNKLATSKKRRPLSERNKSYVMVLTYPAVLFCITFPLHILLSMFEGIMLAVIKKDPSLWQLIYWQSIKSQWDNRRMLFRMRKHIQSRRRVSQRKFLTPFVFIHQKLWMLIKHGVPEIR
jgi:GT2 family glycosyltransferase